MSHAIVLKTAAEMTPQVDEAEAARLVSEGWRRAQGGLVEIIRFGATLLVVSERLSAVVSTREHGANGQITGRDSGLKNWLKEHCPEVNYKTAYGYMSAASGLRREARLAADVPLLALMGADPVPEARAEKLRRRVQKVIADSTLTLLKAASAEQVVPKGGDRRSGLKMTEEEKHLRSIEKARNIWLGHLDDLLGEARTVGSLMLFDADLLDAILLKIDTIRDEVKAAKRGEV